MEQHILKHNEHYLGEIGTRNNLTAVILNNVLLFRLEKKEAERCQGHYVLFLSSEGIPFSFITLTTRTKVK